MGMFYLFRSCPSHLDWSSSTVVIGKFAHQSEVRCLSRYAFYKYCFGEYANPLHDLLELWQALRRDGLRPGKGWWMFSCV